MQDDNLKFTALTIFDSLPPEIKEPRLWTDLFMKKDEIVLAKDTEDGFIGARSLVEGMGLSWSRQLKKFKKNALFHGPRATAVFGDNIFVLHRGIVDEYISGIELKRLPEETADNIRTYQRFFPEFMNDLLETERDKKVIDDYIDSDDGMERLVMDSLCRLQNQGAVKLMASLLTDLMKSDCLSDDGLRATEHIYDLADLAARNRNRLKSVA